MKTITASNHNTVNNKNIYLNTQTHDISFYIYINISKKPLIHSLIATSQEGQIL